MPITFVRELQRLPATRLNSSPSCSIPSRTRVAVATATRGGRLITFDSVATDTPAAATSVIVARMLARSVE
jgi:hypothetical protein